MNRIGGVMVSLLASSVVDRRLRLFINGSTKTIKFVFVASPFKLRGIWEKEQKETGWLGIRIKYPVGDISIYGLLFVSSELALSKSS
ncbi:MAG: hypothetical protein H0A75_04870 [Candidatus Methanofishera endochildressiae]|uniref:Uncharacterized protein n=1 Tax=Candidatus Methanofishera endochildressiae TaxID=2738884 RepID=A0A7Z0MNN0_9GAMM|nr:hypothetical protein [Candidatus Methanofishera endochildressiae]